MPVLEPVLAVLPVVEPPEGAVLGRQRATKEDIRFNSSVSSV